MLTNKKACSSNENPIYLREIFSSENNTVYTIHSDLQRKYCWTEEEIDHLIEHDFIPLYERNKLADTTGEDPIYAEIGKGIMCKIREKWKTTNCNYKEIVDTAQRLTSVCGICLVSLYLYMNKEGITDIEERRKIVDSVIKTKNKQCFKIETTFDDCLINTMYEEIVNNTFSVSKEEKRRTINIFKKPKDKKIITKTFRDLCYKIYLSLTKNLSLDADFKDYLTYFLSYSSIQIEECEPSERVEKFIDVNSYRIGVSSTDIFKSLLCSKGERINERYQLFEGSVRRVSSNDEGCRKRINILKAPYTIQEFIMKLALIIISKDEDICKCDYQLSSKKKGMHYQLEDGVLNTEQGVLVYLDTCIDICNFLYNSIDASNDFNESWYMFTDGRNSSHIWLYNILPCYVISKMSNIECKNYTFDLLLKSYLVYSLKYIDNKSVQYIQSYMYTFSMIAMNCEKYGIDTLKDELDCLYLKTFQTFINSELSGVISHISYNGKTSQGALRGILSLLEFLIQRKYNIKKDNLYRYLTSSKSNISIDHIMPQDLKNEDNDMFIDGNGNLTLLESPLNSAKNDSQDKTAKHYSDSSFISTKLINNCSRFEGLTNDELSEIKTKILPYCCSEDELNKFDVDMIKNRKKQISLFIRRFLNIS